MSMQYLVVAFFLAGVALVALYNWASCAAERKYLESKNAQLRSDLHQACAEVQEVRRRTWEQ